MKTEKLNWGGPFKPSSGLSGVLRLRRGSSAKSPTPLSNSQNSGPVQRGTVHRRLGLLHASLFFICWGTLICGRLVWLQVVHHKDFVDRAARQQQRTFEVAPRRGMLFDRNLHELALTGLADSVYAVPSEITDREAVADALAKVVHTDATDKFTTAHQIDARLNASRNFAWVARKLDPAVIERVKALNLKGCVFPERVQALLPQQSIGRTGIGLCRHR